MSLIQVGYDQWIDPDLQRIKRVLHWPARPSTLYDSGMSTENTVLVFDTDNVLISYWPFERIKHVLNLVDQTWIHELWEKTDG